jgi:hypothetical protein
MSALPNERVIETIVAHSAHPPLGKCVGPRSPKRRTDHVGSLGGEDVIEAGAELRVSVVEDEPDRRSGSVIPTLRAC